MQRALAIAAAALVACGGPQLQERVADLSQHLPATLEAQNARSGDPRTAKIRVWADPGVRALPRWREHVSDQLDYASQLLTPLLGVRLQVERWGEWNRTGELHEALRSLAEADPGEGAMFVIGYVTPSDKAHKVMSQLGDAQTLGKHVVVRAWAEGPETEKLAATLPDLGEAERAEILGAHRRHKQAVVLLHHLAIALGGIAEADASWILHPSYSTQQAGFAERTRELLTQAIDNRLADNGEEVVATALLESIEKSEWGGWIPAHRDEVTRRLRNVIDSHRAGKVATDIPPAAYDHLTRVKELARRGDTQNAIADLDNVISAYPGNAALHQLKCEILLAKPGVGDKATRTACARAGELAPGDPVPHFLVGEALARTGDIAGARAELAQAQAKIANLPTNPEDAWRRLIAIYQAMGALTWTEEVIAQAQLENDPVAAQVAQIRARYGVPRGTKLVRPEHEAALVAAVKKALELVYASKYAEAEKALRAADRRWPGAPGLAAARCDLLLRRGQLAGARAACAKALATEPRTSWALYLSGVMALNDPRTVQTGITQLQKAIAVDPELGQAWRTLGKAYQRAKDHAALEKLAKDYQAQFGQALPP